MSRRIEGALLAAILVLVGGLSWWLTFRPVEEADPARFDALPRIVNGWKAVDLEIDQSVSDMLAADHNVQRAYLHPQRYVVFVYVGYYGTRRGGTPEHTPDVCYPSQGWTIVESTERRLGGEAGFDVQEFVVQKDAETRLVHYWYRTSQVTGITSVPRLRMQHFWGRLTENRGDGALIRLSTQIGPDGVEGARSRLFGLDAAIEGAVAQIWSRDGIDPTATSLRASTPDRFAGPR